jgi:hypothetical protein
MPYKLRIKSMDILPRNTTNKQPDNIYMVGSNDGGITFDHIIEKTNVANGSYINGSYIINTTFENVSESYSTIRMIVNKVGPSGTTGNVAVNIGEWSLPGDVEGMITSFLDVPPYVVTVTNSVFDLSGTPQQQIDFSANESYVFNQSDPTTAGQQIVFGTTYDDKSILYTTGVTAVGTPGQPGAYTQLELGSDFSGDLFYYSDASNNMGYSPVSLSVDNNVKETGDTVVFTLSNNTGIDVSYNITGVTSTDINNALLTDVVSYGTPTTLTYSLTGTTNASMVFTAGGLSETITILNVTEYLVRKHTTNTTYEMSTDGGSTWTENPQITFEANQTYKFDQSNTTNSSEQIVFGTTFDDKANILGTADGVTVVGTPGTSGAYTQLVLGTSFSGDLWYYSANSNGMGYVKSFVQIGEDLDDSSARIQFGDSVSISSNGNIVAVGAPMVNYDANPKTNLYGHVAIYEYNDSGSGSWIQLGNDINGTPGNQTSPSSQFGHSVSLSSDGKTIAIGAPGYSTDYSKEGQVKVYNYNGTGWVQNAVVFQGTSGSDRCGYAVSLSADGNMVAFSIPGYNTKKVKIYYTNGSQYGGDIYVNEENFGYSLQLSSNGNRIVISSNSHIKLFEYSSGWNQLVSIDQGPEYRSVSISGNGEIFAYGKTNIYEYINGDSGLNQLGGQLFGNESSSISLSSDGHTVSINSGQYIKVYDYNVGDDEWVQRSTSIFVQGATSTTRQSLSLSSDGNTFVVGAPYNSVNGISSGLARVYRY